MTFATIINVALMLLCVAVLVQSARMMRSFRAIKSGDLGDMVKSLDNATAQARTVLGELRELLATDGAANARSIASGEALRDELSVMVGIGNAVAERIMEAASTTGERANADEAAPEIEMEGEPVETQPLTSKPAPRHRSRKGGGKQASASDSAKSDASKNDSSDAAALVAMAVAEVEAASAAAAAA